MKKQHKGQSYGQWAAPKEDQTLLIWPKAADLAGIIRDNAARLDAADHVRVQGVPLPEWRRRARAFIGHAGGPLVATGHQTELHHPGVWIKNAVITAAAEACGREGAAYHFAVDTDAPKHLKLKWPGFAEAITDDPRVNNAAWTGLLDPPTPAHLEGLIASAGAARQDGRASELVAAFLGKCRAFLVDQRDAIAPLDLPSVLANAQHALDWDLGLRYHALTLSGLLASPAWAAFVSAVAADAAPFAGAYNRALAEYRSEAGIDSAERPMPDLAVEQEHVELPFWLDDLSAGRRRRASVILAEKRFVLAGREPFVFGTDPEAPDRLLAWLRSQQLRLAPRALSLTMFLRLFVCDLFVHGIGGGHYDQVTDRIIRDYFRLEPPAFAVATATLYHPLSVGRERVCMPCLVHEGHELAHRVLGPAKQEWLARIAQAPTARERRAVFEQMHEARRAAMPRDPAYRQWQAKLEAAKAKLAEEADLFDRELFYGVQPPGRLAGMIGRVRAAFGGIGR